MTVIVDDPFTRANSSSTMGSEPVTGNAYTYPDGVWGITSNKAYCVSASGAPGYAEATVNPGTLTFPYTIEEDITLSSATNRVNSGLCFHSLGSRANGLFFVKCEITVGNPNGLFIIGKHDAGAVSYGTGVSPIGFNEGDTYHLTVTVNSDSISARITGTGVDATATYTKTAGDQSKFNSATAFGFRTRYDTADEDDLGTRHDNLKLTTTGGGGGGGGGTTKTNAFENGLANGTALTTANSGYTSNDAFNRVEARGSATVTVDTTAGQDGDTRSMKLYAPATTSSPNRCFVEWDTDYTDQYYRFYATIASGNNHFTLVSGMSGSRRAWAVVILPDGRVQLRDVNNAAVAASTNTLPFNQPIRIEGRAFFGAATANNVLEAKVFVNPAAATPAFTVTATGVDLGAIGGKTRRIRLGIIKPVNANQTVWIDKYAVNDTAYLGPASGGGGTTTETVTDPFDRANSASTLGSAPTGQAWTAVDGTWGISSNQAYLATKSNANTNEAWVDTTFVDQTVSADIKTSTVDNRTRAGLLARYLDANTYLYVELNSGSDVVDLRKKTAGGSTSLHSEAIPGAGSTFDGVLDDTPTPSVKLGATWYVAAPDNAKDAGRVYQAIDTGSYIYISTWSADRAYSLGGATTTINSLLRIDSTTLDFDSSWIPDFDLAAGASGPDLHAMAYDGTYIYVGGNFNSARGHTGTLTTHSKVVRFNAATGAIDNTWNPGTINAEVYTLVADPDEDVLYIGGQFTTVNGTTRNRLAAVKLSDASLWSWNPNRGSNHPTDMRLFNKTSGGKRIWCSFNGQGTIGGSGTYTCGLIHALGTTNGTAGNLDWGKDEGSGGGHRCAASDDAQLVAYGTKGTGGNVSHVYSASGVEQYSGQSINTDGDIQGADFHTLGNGNVIYMHGTHDETFAVNPGGSAPNTGSENGSGFGAYPVGTGVLSSYRPQFVASSASPTFSGSSGGFLKVWAVKSIRPGMIMVGGVFTGVKTSPPTLTGTGGSAVSPAPKRIAFFEEGVTGGGGGGTILANTTYHVEFSVVGNLCTVVVSLADVVVVSFTHTLAGGDETTYAAGTGIGICSYPNTSTDDDMGTRWNNFDGSGTGTGGGGGGGGGGTDTWTWKNTEPWGGGGLNTFAIDPNNNQKIIIGTDVGGFMASSDQGVSFKKKMKGTFSDDHRKVAGLIAYDRRDAPGSTYVIAGVGAGSAGSSSILRSGNWGDTWTDVQDGSLSFEGQNPATGTGLPGRPRSVGRLFAYDGTSGTNGYLYAATLDTGVWRSTDHGDTWTQISMASGSGAATGAWMCRCIAIDPNNPTDLYVGVYDVHGVGGLYRIASARTGTGLTATKVSPTGIARVEDLIFIGTTMYAACGQDGIQRVASPYGTGNWTDISGTRISKSSQWIAIDGYNNGGSHVICVGCYAPIRVNSSGDSSASGIAYGSTYRNTAANSGTTWDYNSYPGSSGYPSGGDGDYNVNDQYTGKRFWRADEDPNTLLGRQSSGSTAAMLCMILCDQSSTNGATKRFYLLGPSGCVWRSTDNAASWKLTSYGIVIASMQGIYQDDTRAGYFVAGNMDLDVFVTKDYGDSSLTGSGWQNYNMSGNTTSHWVHVDRDGVYWACNNQRDDTPNDGDLWTSGTFPANGMPSWSIVSGHRSKTAGRRSLAFASGLTSGGAKRIVSWVDSYGFIYSDNGGSTWSGPSGPSPSSTNNMRAGSMQIIWPDPFQPYLYMFLRGTHADAGVWRSSDRGASWSRIWAVSTSGVREGYIAAAPGSYQTVYVTTSTGDVTRIRNAHSTADRDTISGIARARALCFDLDGNIYIYSESSSTVPAALWRQLSPPTSGTTFATKEDLFDSATKATSAAGQELAVLDVNNIVAVSDGQHIFLTSHGIILGTAS